MTKDELETVYLRGLARSLPGFPEGEVSKSENPDFLVRGADHLLGIELTRLFQRPAPGQSPLREQESAFESRLLRWRRHSTMRWAPRPFT